MESPRKQDSLERGKKEDINSKSRKRERGEEEEKLSDSPKRRSVQEENHPKKESAQQEKEQEDTNSSTHIARTDSTIVNSTKSGDLGEVIGCPEPLEIKGEFGAIFPEIENIEDSPEFGRQFSTKQQRLIAPICLIFRENLEIFLKI
ncbi:hypothetical protein SUGI_0318420 [Cryptomeria japonica]|nr:hypothetical protein SUGI_0318420 [Cryptomeria japonica]